MAQKQDRVIANCATLETAFSTFTDWWLEEFRELAFRMAKRMLRNWHQAEDAVSVVYPKMLRAIEHDPSRMATKDVAKRVVIRVTSNWCVDVIRNQKRRPPDCSLDNPAPDGKNTFRDVIPSVDTWRDEIELGMFYRKVINRLKDKNDRKLFKLLWENELSYQEMATQLGTSETAIRSRVNRLRPKLVPVFQMEGLDPTTGQWLETVDENLWRAGITKNFPPVIPLRPDTGQTIEELAREFLASCTIS